MRIGPSDEATRIEALPGYARPVAATESDFGDFTALAAQLCGVPVSLLSLVDSEQQRFQSCLGLNSSEAALSIPFSEVAMQSRGVVEISDALLDSRFAGSPLVTGAPHIRFYAAVPLITVNGRNLGTLCVMDLEPRTLTQAQRDALERLARQAMSRLELQHATQGADTAPSAPAAFQALFDFTPIALMMLGAEGVIAQVNHQTEALFGYASGQLAGQPFDQILSAPSRDEHAQLLRAFLMTPTTAAGHSRLTGIKQDGTVFPIDISLGSMKSSDGMLVVAVQDLSEDVTSDAEIRRALHEKETLLKEIHHRVKNNLQIISSLLSMQAEGSPDAHVQLQLLDSIHRVRSMALIHERLYRSATLASIDFGDYARSLTTFLFRSYKMSANVELIVDIEPTELNIETAIPLGLVLNEVVCNALKHAFTDGRPGSLRVSVRRSGAGLSLTVADTGPGLPIGFDVETATSMGMTLVNSLARQLKADLTVESNNGASFHLFFKELSYAAR